jgi:hypothetical protein
MPDTSTVASTFISGAEPVLMREVFDGCLRCYGPTHIGECPPGL